MYLSQKNKILLSGASLFVGSLFCLLQLIPSVSADFHVKSSTLPSPCQSYADAFEKNPWLARVLSKDLENPCSTAKTSADLAGEPVAAGRLLDNSTAKHRKLHRRSIQQQDLDKLESLEKDAKWRWHYVDEQDPGYKVLTRDPTLDSRLANIIYTVKSFQVVNTDNYLYNSGDSKEDLLAEKRSTGSRFNDSLCGKQLKFMVDLLEELTSLVEQKRQDRRQEWPSFDKLDTSNLLQEKHIRLARILDSFGRYESGTLMGRYTFGGSPVECSGTELPMEPSSQVIKSQYCVATLTLKPLLDPRLLSRIKNPYEGETALSVGICIPETCHSPSYRSHASLLKTLIDSQFKLPSSMFVSESLKLHSVYCAPEPDSPASAIPFGGKVLIAVTVAWLSIVGCATYMTASKEKFDEIQHPALRHALIQLDIRQSWLDFIGTEDESNGKGGKVPEARRVELDAVNPIKVFGCAFVVFAHVFVVNAACTMDTLRAYRSIETDPMIFMVLSGTLVVDTFYVITGIIIGYITMKRTRKQTKSLTQKIASASNGDAVNGSRMASSNREDQIDAQGSSMMASILSFVQQSVSFAALRCLRLLPLYFVVFWFTRNLFEILNPGAPTWDHGFNKYTARGACRRESLLTPFTFEAAYKPIAEQCLPPSWSVAGDLFFSVTLAPIIILMTRKPKLAALISVAICLLSSGTMFIDIQNLRPTLRDDLKELRAHSFAQLFHDLSIFYTAPHHRVFSPLIGVMAGYFLYFYSESTSPGKGLNQWPAWFKGPATNFAIGSVTVLIFASPFVPIAKETIFKVVPIHHHFFDHSMTTGRLVWCLANAVILLRMMTDWKDSYLMKQGATKFWKTLVRLNYAILLIHLNVIAYDLNIQTLGVNLYSKYRVLQLFIFAYAVSSKFSVALHVLFENPLDKLIKGMFLGPPRSKQHDVDMQNSKSLRLEKRQMNEADSCVTSGSDSEACMSSPV